MSERLEERMRRVELRVTKLEEQAGWVRLSPFSDETRPSPAGPYRVIWNIDDGQMNISDGSDWTLPDGSVT